jgi:hypothetical protein
VKEVDEFDEKRSELFNRFDEEIPTPIKDERNKRLKNGETAVENDVPVEIYSMISTSCKYKKPIA